MNRLSSSSARSSNPTRDNRTKPNRTASRAPVEMILTAPPLARFTWLVHGFSTRRGGVSSFDSLNSSDGKSDLNLGKVPWDSAKNVAENRRRLVSRLRAKNLPLILQRQIHSDLIRVLDGDEFPAPPPAGDALITNRPGLLLAVLVADCLPILLVDAKQRVVAALHCGWRGTERRLAAKAVGRMRLLFGSRPEDLWAAIGPGIGSCCYAVGPEVVEEFASQFSYADTLLVPRTRPLTPLELKRDIMIHPLRSNFGLRVKKEIYLDLPRANVQQLRDAGVRQRQIYSAALCTSCHPELFFSHRRDAGHTGRMMGVIAKEWIFGQPDIVVEILAQTTADKDRHRKMAVYSQFGVQEYWIVDPERQTIELYCQSKEGLALARRFSADETFESRLLIGFRIEVNRIF